MSIIRFILIAVLSFNLGFVLQAQEQEPLLTNPEIEIEATVAVNALYNFNFHKAEVEFNWMKYKHPNHPMPYFLLGFSEWWKMMPNPDIEKYDDQFIAYMDSCIYFAEELYDENEDNVDAIFFLSAAYGFLGRIYSDRGKWAKATFAGRNALKYLKKSKQFLDMSPEFLFGDGLINYYTEWIKENYVFLRPVLMFFPDGNKELGLEQLEKAGKTAFYTRTEAQYWLMYINTTEEYNYKKAYPISEYLHRTFPNNAYFTRYYARLSWSTGRYVEADSASRQLLQGIEEGRMGYEAESGRYASYYIAYINMFINRDYDTATIYFKKCIEFAESIKAFDSGYYKWSHYHLAKIALKHKDRETAKHYYKQYKKIENRKSDPKYKEAKKFLKNYRKQNR